MSYKINIPDEIHKKVMHWVNKADFEVSGFGRVEFNKETKEFTVLDAYLLPQEGGAVHTDIDAAGIAALQKKVSGLDGTLRWWWHSHVKMDVFWSSTDKETIKDIGRHGWVTATVFNQNEETRSAFCYRTESTFGNGTCFIDEVPLFILTDVDEEQTKEWDDEFTENVKRRSYVQHTMLGNDITDYSKYGYHNWRDDWKQPGSTLNGTGMEFIVGDQEGLAGYPVNLEAKALNMSPHKYVKLLNNNDAEVIMDLEEQLMQAETMGKLQLTDNIYYKRRKNGTATAT